jgi:hypothetical protein
MISIGESSAKFLICETFLQIPGAGNRVFAKLVTDRDGGLDRLDSVSVRVDDLVKDGAKRRRLRRSSILDKIINTNNWQPSDQGRSLGLSIWYF